MADTMVYSTDDIADVIATLERWRAVHVRELARLEDALASLKGERRHRRAAGRTSVPEPAPREKRKYTLSPAVREKRGRAAEARLLQRTKERREIPAPARRKRGDAVKAESVDTQAEDEEAAAVVAGPAPPRKRVDPRHVDFLGEAGPRPATGAGSSDRPATKKVRMSAEKQRLLKEYHAGVARREQEEAERAATAPATDAYEARSRFSHAAGPINEKLLPAHDGPPPAGFDPEKPAAPEAPFNTGWGVQTAARKNRKPPSGVNLAPRRQRVAS